MSEFSANLPQKIARNSIINFWASHLSHQLDFSSYEHPAINSYMNGFVHRIWEAKFFPRVILICLYKEPYPNQTNINEQKGEENIKYNPGTKF